MTRTRTRRVRRTVAAGAAAVLLLAACGGDEDGDAGAEGDDTATEESTEDATESEGGAEPIDFKGCQVTDAGGVDDASFNESAFDGLTRAENELGIEKQVLESSSADDFAPNITSLIEQDCDLIFTIGFLLGDATESAAQDNPDLDFAIVDNAYEADYDNLRELTFNTSEAAFLAGYAAAAVSETGVVGTYGGVNIPPVTVFMDGFVKGVVQYNADNDADVEVEGWDGTDGLFTGDFEDQDKGRSFTESLIDEGADVILPVAGPVGQGSIAAARDADGVKVIWVDSDGCEATDGCDVILTSILKRVDNAVFDTVEATINNDGLPGEGYLGTLENEGVGIADFVTFDLPDGTQEQIDEYRQMIIDGEVNVDELPFS